MKFIVSCVILLAVLVPAAAFAINDLTRPGLQPMTLDANGDDQQIAWVGYTYQGSASFNSCPSPNGAYFCSMNLLNATMEWRIFLGGTIYAYPPEGTQAVLKIRNNGVTIYTLDLNPGLNAPNHMQVVPFQYWGYDNVLDMVVGGAPYTGFNFTTHLVEGKIVTTNLYWQNV
jgi:hypothetical protein